ncbi:MAG TPA: hypothetical protein VGL93_19330 [Streptosporangiaceae bacterium]|jgi:hypothetical protein
MTTRLSVGLFSPSVVLAMADLAGAGLEVDEVPATSSAVQLDDLLEGRLDAALTSPDNVLAYRHAAANPAHRAHDVRIVAAVDRGLGLSLFAAPGAGGAAHGILAVDVPTSGFAYAAYELAARRGLTAGADYEVRALGTTPQRATALAAGRCTMTVLGAGSDLRAEAAGCLRLSRATSLGPYLGTVLATRGDRVETGRAPLAALVRAVTAACAELAAGGRSDEARAVAARLFGLGPAEARRYAATLADPDEGLVPDGRVDPESLRTIAALRARYGPRGWTEADALGDPGLVDTRLLPG